MATKPEDRYDSARALAEDVTKWLDDEPVTAYRGAGLGAGRPVDAPAPDGGDRGSGGWAGRPDRAGRRGGRAEPVANEETSWQP